MSLNDLAHALKVTTRETEKYMDYCTKKYFIRRHFGRQTSIEVYNKDDTTNHIMIIHIEATHPSTRDFDKTALSLRENIDDDIELRSWYTLTYPYHNPSNIVDIIRVENFIISDPIRIDINDEAAMFQFSTVHNYDTSKYPSLIEQIKNVDIHGYKVWAYIDINDCDIDFSEIAEGVLFRG